MAARSAKEIIAEQLRDLGMFTEDQIQRAVKRHSSVEAAMEALLSNANKGGPGNGGEGKDPGGGGGGGGPQGKCPACATGNKSGDNTCDLCGSAAPAVGEGKGDEGKEPAPALPPAPVLHGGDSLRSRSNQGKEWKAKRENFRTGGWRRVIADPGLDSEDSKDLDHYSKAGFRMLPSTCLPPPPFLQSSLFPA